MTAALDTRRRTHHRRWFLVCSDRRAAEPARRCALGTAGGASFASEALRGEPGAAGQHLDREPERPRVLLVEDQPLIRQELAALLDDEGIEVVGEAARGELGVELAGLLVPDVVLMDLRMPGMGGIDATRLIRDALPRTQVVLLSAYDDPGLRDRARRADAHAYLVKGCRADAIVTAIREAWEATRGTNNEGASR